jgi:two-component system sensor histidine kinase CpxA
VRGFFLQIFLSFWIATILTFVVATLTNPRVREPAGSVSEALTSSTTAAAHVMLVEYEHGGCKGLGGLPREFTLLNASGDGLCGPPISPQLRSFALESLSARQATTRRIGPSWVCAIALRQSDGATLIVIHAIPEGLRRWWPTMPPSALPISVLVTFLFAYLLTRPIRALSLAIRKFTAGDMAVRVPVNGPPWSGIGGADVHTLMDDFNKMADRIQDLMQSQKVLVRDISHELRSPLARLRLALELAREDPAHAGMQLDRVEHETDRLNAVIGETLTLSLMEASPDLLQARKFSLTSLFDELLPDMRFEAEARHMHLKFTPAPEAITVAGYPELMRRALENVLRNAIRYSPPEGLVEIEIQVQAERNGDSGSSKMAEIRIADHGPGVPQASLKKIFGPFFRVDASRQESTGGFGVGLAIAERSIHLHGGVIRAENRKEGGLQILIRIPISSRSS